MTGTQMLALHNRLARERDSALWPRGAALDRVKLGGAIALLRTLRPVPPLPSVKNLPKMPKPRPDMPIRDAIVEALSVVTHYQHKETGERVEPDEIHLHDVDQLHTVGLTYAECLTRVKRKIPKCQVNLAHLRGAVLSAKNEAPGYIGVTLADIRPHGMKGKSR